MRKQVTSLPDLRERAEKVNLWGTKINQERFVTDQIDRDEYIARLQRIIDGGKNE